jgi:hypothetical protein
VLIANVVLPAAPIPSARSNQVKGSLLCLLFDPVNSHLLRHDASGRVFLDHDPVAFGLLLRHLREVRAAAGEATDRTMLFHNDQQHWAGDMACHVLVLVRGSPSNDLTRHAACF